MQFLTRRIGVFRGRCGVAMAVALALVVGRGDGPGDVCCTPLVAPAGTGKTILKTGFEAVDTKPDIADYQIVAEPVHSGKAAVEGEVSKPNSACFLRIAFLRQ